MKITGLNRDEFKILNQDKDQDNGGDNEGQDNQDQDSDGEDGDSENDDKEGGNNKSKSGKEGESEEDGDGDGGDDELIDVDAYDQGDAGFGEVEELQDKTKLKTIEDTIKRAANAAYGSMSGALKEYVKDYVLAPAKKDWKSILASYVDTISQNSKRVMGNRRYVHQDIYIYGDKTSEAVDKIVIAVDISGSITEEMAVVFTNELNSIMANVEYDEIIILYCDTQVHEDKTQRFGKGTKMKINFYSGGGTAFQPVFDWLDKNKIVPSVLIYFTDLEGPVPKKPNWQDKIIWGCTGKNPHYIDQFKGFGNMVSIEI